MPSNKFAWGNLPAPLLARLARDVALDDADAAGALSAEFGPWPNDDFVADAWVTLREAWLAEDPESLADTVKALWRPGGANGHRPPRGAKEELAWLRKRNNTPRLREVVLAQLMVVGAAQIAKPPDAERELKRLEAEIQELLSEVVE